MARVKGGGHERRLHKKVLKGAKGYYGRKKNTIRAGKNAVERGLQYAYRDRRNKKRDFRGLWIQRINAAARLNGLTYSQFIRGLKLAGIVLDRKVLAAIAVDSPKDFEAIAKQAQAALKKKAA
ncbi:MAG: 50S ribosomal protein L20 [Proteobacteria bacterium]|nr:50S ribosomal protein L20 [Pseudomonadota bacterium]